MADVSCLMDKTTQILLPPCWCGGVWLVLPTSMYMKIESNLALSPSSRRKRMPATMLSDIYNYFTSTMTLSGDRTLCPFLIRHYYCTVSADILKKKKETKMARMVRCGCMAVCVSPGSHWSTKLLFSSSSSPPGAWAWPPAWRRCVGPCWAQQRKAAVMTHSITLDTKQRWTSNKKTTGRTNSLISVPENKAKYMSDNTFHCTGHDGCM